MPNSYFQFKEFRIDQDKSGMKVTTDACLFGGWVASELKTQEIEPKRILDIGTGTGLLSLMLVQVAKESVFDAIEINEEAFREASSNFSSSNWHSRLNCIHAPLQTFESDAYDLIICNPPFFDRSQKGKSVNKNHAVHSTLLSAGELLENVLRLLSKDGVFYLLYPEREMKSFIELSKQFNLKLKDLVTVRNRDGKQVFRMMASFDRISTSFRETEIIIRDSEGLYTLEFWKLLKDYYLEYNAPING